MGKKTPAIAYTRTLLEPVELGGTVFEKLDFKKPRPRHQKHMMAGMDLANNVPKPEFAEEMAKVMSACCLTGISPDEALDDLDPLDFNEIAGELANFFAPESSTHQNKNTSTS